VLGATLLILTQSTKRRPSGAPSASRPSVGAARLALVMVCQLAVGIYGGYFGAAMGIIMLAFLGLVVPDDIQRRNALKNFLAVLINGTASVYFIVSGLVNVQAALLMMAGAIGGGLVGGRLARRASARLVRAIVVAIGLGLSALLAYRSWTR
jgi:uncharacterized protein